MHFFLNIFILSFNKVKRPHHFCFISLVNLYDFENKKNDLLLFTRKETNFATNLSDVHLQIERSI